MRVNLAQTLRRQSTNRKYYLQWYRGRNRQRVWKLEGNEEIEGDAGKIEYLIFKKRKIKSMKLNENDTPYFENLKHVH